MDKILVLGYLIYLLYIKHIYCNEKEYCNGKTFQPECNDGEIIIMKSALYGRMTIGKCVPRDLGFLGCSSDVLPIFDDLCSGRQTCQVQIIDDNIRVSGGCLDGLKLYLEADYECTKAVQLDGHCSSTDIELKQNDVFLSSLELANCIASNQRKFTIKAKEGQVLNISMINVASSGNEIYGSIQAIKSDQTAVLASGARMQHILSTTDHQVVLNVQNNEVGGNFILHITVSGCPNMSPPDGAWMTRDGNEVEIGCHSGAKSWSLKCVDNQWSGSIGLCGSVSDTEIGRKDMPINKTQETTSLNVLLFAGSSVVILISAIIFLFGVCILRRKLLDSSKYNEMQNTDIDCNTGTLLNNLPSTYTMYVNRKD